MAADHAYRPDIDGLRTLAVVPVVLYHAQVAPFSGGYVGVDVFFVISGFLITRILLDDLDRGRFSLWTFYERRARRILPALGACVAATLAAGVLLLPPSDLAALGASVLRVALFLSNYHFWKEGGYFGRDAEEQPLLHTWSLAVEEQFYIVWPVMLAVAIHRLPGRWRAGLVLALIGLSFAAAAWRTGSRASFFLPQYRAWELGMGCVLALGMIPPIAARRAREAVSALGLALVLAPAFFYTPATPFPGWAALPPCLGAAMLIHANAGRDTAVARLLSLKPIVFVGLISYSLYLWHWPVLVLSRLALNRDLHPAETALAIAASLALAVLSWRFVEAPFRRRGGVRLSRAAILTGSAVGLAALASIGQAAVATDGGRWMASPEVLAAENAGRSINPLRAACHVNEAGSAPAPQKACSSAPGNYQVLLWGDSHADHFAPAVAAWAGRAGLAARQASKSGCRPLATGRVEPALGVGSAACAAFNGAVLDELGQVGSVRLVILSSWWLAGGGALEPRLAQTLSEIRRRAPGARIVLLGSTPEMAFWPSQCLSRARHNRRDERECRSARATNAGSAARADAILRTVAARERGVTFVPLWDALCRGEVCRTVEGEVILLRDHNHFTLAGAERVLQRPLAALGGPGASGP